MRPSKSARTSRAPAEVGNGTEARSNRQEQNKNNPQIACGPRCMSTPRLRRYWAATFGVKSR
jgi:hypothetical protein